MLHSMLQLDKSVCIKELFVHFFSNSVIIAEFVSVFHSHILSSLYLQTKLTDFDIEVIDLCHCKPL